MPLVTNVKWAIHGGSRDDTVVHISEFMTREELMSKLSSGTIEKPTVGFGGALCLKYYNDTREVCILVSDHTSEIDEKWFSFSPASELVQASVRDDVDYVRDYSNKKQDAISEGGFLTVSEYLSTIR